MFGNADTDYQDEDTPFHPRSPYGVSKVAAHHAIVNYRESYDMFCCSGICFNHESPRRGIEFVTRKITDAVARVRYGLQHEVRLGNINARRDWGYAGDYVEAMWLMLQADIPDDYVIATGITQSVYDFYSLACKYAGILPSKYLVCDSDLIRPAEVNYLCGNYSKIGRELGWYPKTGFDQLVGMMVHHDMERYR
jgi:GDPmannose 4,6-dehydratase